MRFAGSNISFAPTGLRSAGGSTNASAAAGINDVSANYAVARQNSVNAGELAAAALGNKSAERQQAMASAAAVEAAGLQALVSARNTDREVEGALKINEDKLKTQRSLAPLNAITGVLGAGLGLAASVWKPGTKTG